jgi:hypothetical protein
LDPTQTITKIDRKLDHLDNQATSFASRHEWTLVGLLAVATFILGCFGFAEVLDFGGQPGQNSWWDITYASFQMFIFEAGEPSAGWPLYLQVARTLAPLIVLYTAASAIWARVNKEVALYALLLRKRRFVVICGIGETGFRIAKDYCLNSDKRVVVVDQDPLNALAAELENYGAIVVYGNAMDPLVLIKARAVYAKEVFLCTSDDKANIAIAKAAERLTRRLSDRDVRRMERIAERHEPSIAGDPPSLGLRCFLCVDSPDIYEVFSSHSFFEANTNRFAIRLFNRRETFARNIFRVCAPDIYYRPETSDDPRMHIAFVGFTALTREMILQTALTAHYTDFRLPTVTVITQREFEEKIQRFLHRFPHLDKVMDIRFVYEDPMTISEDRWRALQSDLLFSVCYVAVYRDVEGILSARRLNRLRRHAGMPPLNFVVCLNQQNFLAEIIDDDFVPISIDKSALPEHEPIEYFETLDYTISIDVVVNEHLDMLARTLHNAYLRTQTARGGDAGGNASIVPWSELPAHKKKANQHAAAHIDVKLRIAGCASYGIDAAVEEVPFPPEGDMLEQLAQLEHRRWMADKYLAGYSYGPERDEDRMLHPDLIPWEELSDTDKEKDRDNIRQIPKLLAQIDEKVGRVD